MKLSPGYIKDAELCDLAGCQRSVVVRACRHVSENHTGTPFTRIVGIRSVDQVNVVYGKPAWRQFNVHGWSALQVLWFKNLVEDDGVAVVDVM